MNDEEDEPAVMSTYLIPLPRPDGLTTAEVLDLLQIVLRQSTLPRAYCTAQRTTSAASSTTQETQIVAAMVCTTSAMTTVGRTTSGIITTSTPTS